MKKAEKSHLSGFLISLWFKLLYQDRNLLRRPTASKANPPTANNPKVAGSGVVTAVVSKFVVRRPPVSEEPGARVSANELVTVNVMLELVKFMPGELNGTEEEGVTGLVAEFMERLPESSDPINVELVE